ncbi:endonuclease [uncultured Methanolobus sp.]|uniref:endonuclease III domain-containing protein n=1 Tax=uncultured Methanolobus sp. TaxID=218300 RepID=UPI0029C6A131|nr:endonuclease [uncultured Methanolobus sp.]
MRSGILCKVYDLLLDDMGPQYWWPADTAFEVVIGALLTQQTKWTNVEKAINGLKEHGLLEVRALADADIGLLEELVRCCGFYRQKASRLKGIASFFVVQGMEDVFSMPVEDLRKTMLSLKGVGNETADSIVLYAANKPKFVIDAYTTRIMKCIGIRGNYMQLQRMFEKELPTDIDIYKEYHALIVEYSKAYCGRNRCDECILKELNENGY